MSYSSPLPTQVVVASTLYGAATVVAAIESGALRPADRRVLLVANTTNVPEIAVRVDELSGFETLAPHFDSVHSYNEAVAPVHPSVWNPRYDEAPIFERYLRSRWDLGDGLIELVVESIQVPPARALGNAFAGSQLTVYADGLMTYSPTRTNLGAPLSDRVRTILHPDLIPGLRPVLLREYEVPSVAFDVEALRKVLDRMHEHVAPRLPSVYRSDDPPALVIGQYLAAIGVLSESDERRLHERMLRAAHEAGASTIWFKGHPSAPAASIDELVAWSRSEGLDVVAVAPATPAEALFDAMPPKFVVSCFSTALVTAARLYGIPGATVGVDDLLEALKPFENSNRIPVTIVGELFPDLEVPGSRPAMPMLDDETTAIRVQPLVDTVAYCMQPTLLADARGPAEQWLADHVDGPATRYFKRKRLTSLAMPGGTNIPLVRQVVGPARRWAQRRGGVVLKVAKQTKRFVDARSG